jgi:mRNA-degrading endonuclease RelE of RelBE toxin-antitoxin system
MFIQWTNSAFRELENLPQDIAFEVIKQTDFLTQFPEMGNSLESRFARLRDFRHLVIRRKFRVVYQYREAEKTVYILAVQRCRQKLPTSSDLKRRKDKSD